MPDTTESPIRRRTKAEILDYLITKNAELEARVAKLEAAEDDWDTPLEAAEEFVADVVPAPTVERPTDAEWEAMTPDQQSAWLRVQQGSLKGEVINADPGESETVTIQLPGGMGSEFPRPSEKAKDAWALAAESIMENIPSPWPIGKAEAIEAYQKGGPLWLAAFGQAGHDFIMGLPYGMKQNMVREVCEYAPQSGAELGRDILRLDAQASRDFGGALMDVDPGTDIG